MNPSESIIIHTDGAARGNPGPAAYAFIIERLGAADIEDKGFLGETTNNIAEYEALLRALRRAKELNAGKIVVHSDSELMIKQMRGEYKVKNPGLRELFEEADELQRGFADVEFRHVPRDQNKRADRLCNEALDAALGKKPKAPATTQALKKAPVLPKEVREEALTSLQACLTAWHHGDVDAPSAEDILDQLWSILTESGIIK